MVEPKQFEERDPDAAAAARERIRGLLRLEDAPDRALDLGGGDGAALPGERALVLDMDLGLLKTARARGALAVAGDMQRLPFRDGSAARALLCHSLEHCPDTRAALDELARVLKPGGRAVIVAPNAAGLRQIQTLLQGDVRPAGNRPDGDTQHQHQYTLKLLRRVLEDHPQLELLEVRGDVVTFPLMRTLRLRWLGRALGRICPRLSDALIAVCRKRGGEEA